MFKKKYIQKFACFCIFMPVFIILTAVNAHSGDIGFIDMNRIILEAQDALDVRDLLKLEEERYEIRFEKKKGLLKGRIADSLQGWYSTGDYEEYFRELNEIKEDYQHIQNLMEIREVELTHGLFKKIMDAVKNAANKKGYKYVFELTESRIFFQDNNDDLTDDVIAEMDKTHYEIRLLEDLKIKKGMHLGSDVQMMRQRELTEMERMIASLEKRHKETKSVPEGLNWGKEIAAKEDKKTVSLEEGKKDADKPPKPVSEGLNPGIDHKTIEEEKKDIKKLQSAVIPETKPILKKESIKAPDWEKEIKESEPVRGGISAKVLIKSKLLAQPVHNSNVLDVIDADGEVTIIKSLANYWYYVQAFDGKRGYLFAAAFDKFVTGYETVFIKGVKVSIRDETYSKIFGYISNEYVLLLDGEGSELAKIAAPCCTGYIRKIFVNKKE